MSTDPKKRTRAPRSGVRSRSKKAAPKTRRLPRPPPMAPERCKRVAYDLENLSESLPDSWLYSAVASAALHCRHHLEVQVVADDGPVTGARGRVDALDGHPVRATLNVTWACQPPEGPHATHRLMCGRTICLAQHWEALVFHVTLAMVALDYALLGPDCPVNAAEMAEVLAERELEEHREDPYLLDAPDPASMEELDLARLRLEHERDKEARP